MKQTKQKHRLQGIAGSILLVINQLYYALIRRQLPSQTITPPRLPSEFMQISVEDERGAFIIVGSAPPLAYESGLIQGNLWGTPHIVWLIRQIIGKKGILIDIGANIGGVAVPIAKDGNAVVAIEMIPLNCIKLYMAKLMNDLENMEIIGAAASSYIGTIQYGGSEAWGMIGNYLLYGTRNLP